MSRRNSFKYSNNALVSHQSSSSIEKLDGNFCGAFQEHYDYLMDKGLIETCQVSLLCLKLINKSIIYSILYLNQYFFQYHFYL